MAQIIEIETFRHGRAPGATVPDGGAEILFFLGVRYERMPETAPSAPEPAGRPARGGRGRKRRA